jgi:small nuclear ribonucleoprotein (snRNP)-like protein
MCKYSLEAYRTRKAVKGETLVANQHSGSTHGVFTKAGTRYDGTLTCVKDGQKLTIEKLEFIAGLDDPEVIRRYGGDRRAFDYVGKRVVVELVDGRGVPTGMDSIRWDGMRWGVPLAWLKSGTEVYVGEKKEVSLDEKLQLDDKSLRSVAVDMALIDPNPKPEDAEEKREEEREKRRDEEKEEVRALYADLTTPTRVRGLVPAILRRNRTE